MGEPLPKQVLDTAVNPDEITQQSFDLERRGFDQRQVQAYLRAVADSLHDAQQREADMRTRLGRAVRRAETAENALRDTPSHDPAELDRQFGDQVASVLDAARVAAEQRTVAAEKSATKIMANAKTEATRMRAEADAILRERRSEAELAATDIVGDGRTEAQAIREQARVDADAMLAQAADRVQRARDECDALISEAEEARAQILDDMERRRRQARAQVERLRVGRDRLLRSYEVVRRTLEETTLELKSSLKEAKVRGDGAERAITAEPLASREQLEAELRDAKMIGRITISDPGPSGSDSGTGSRNAALRSPALPRPLDTTSSKRAKPAGEPRRLRVSEAMKKGAAAAQPKAPAVAPLLRATPANDDDQSASDPIAAMIEAADAKLADTAAPVSAADPELAKTESTDSPAPGLFAALRTQRRKGDPKKKREPQKKDDPKKKNAVAAPAAVAAIHMPGLEAQRDAVIADAAKQLEKRLKRALADEQNELLAGIRASKRKRVALTSIVGDVDDHVNRYVRAIHEVAAITYGAGAALLDAEAPDGQLPAGAVEELLALEVVMPIRERLASLDEIKVDLADEHLDPVRAFYRQRKVDHLGFAASRLANLLCVAGLCDALPDHQPLPWAPPIEPQGQPAS